LDNPNHRLIVYGTLAPGRSITSCWRVGRDLGALCNPGRMGQWYGFKAFKWEPGGEEHGAWLFTSRALPERLPELDDFEGEAYQRVVIPVQVGRRRVLAQIYEGGVRRRQSLEMWGEGQGPQKPAPPPASPSQPAYRSKIHRLKSLGGCSTGNSPPPQSLDEKRSAGFSLLRTGWKPVPPEILLGKSSSVDEADAISPAPHGGQRPP